jgi:outer membrane lipoprotein-sorting protein
MQAILAFSLLIPSFLLQQLPDAAAIMSQQAAAAQKYRTTQYIGDSSIEMLSGPLSGTKTTGELSIYIKNPGKSRIEIRTQGQPTILVVSDGDFIWTYNQSARQYTKTAAATGMPGRSCQHTFNRYSVGLEWRENKPENGSRGQC